MPIAGAAVVVLVAFAAAGCLLIRRRLVAVEVVGDSMRPALAAGNRALVRRVRAADVRVGQIVVFEQPRRDQRGWTWPGGHAAPVRRWMIKRVAAVSGDPVPRAVAERLHTVPGAVVPAGHLAVLGDNQADSIDSRVLGYVPADRVLGVVLRRLRTASG